mgnify:FL=1
MTGAIRSARGPVEGYVGGVVEGAMRRAMTGLVCGVWVGALPSVARADGVVLAVQEADDVGAWSTWQPAAGTTTGEAFVVRGDDRVPLSVGDTIRDDDLLVTRRGRVRIAVEGKGEITVYDGTVVLLRDYGLEHVLGGVLIEVQDAFRVEYARSEAVVEGTRFRVEGNAAGVGVVVVEEGRVRVRSGAEAVAVNAGEQAAVDGVSAPQHGDAPWALLPPSARRSFPVSVGPQVGLGRAHHLGLDAATSEWRTDVLVRWRLPGAFSVSATGGLAANTQTAHVPVSAGVEWWTGPVGLGVAMEGLLGVAEPSPTDTALAVGAAGYGTVNLSVPVHRRFTVDGRALVGWSTGLQTGGTLGVSVKP